ncbi:MAG: hypothetical protein JSS34_08675 [Proteobacteria bacterium]|nr:hypothetical protein [Pseudomonadota bacterium]
MRKMQKEMVLVLIGLCWSSSSFTMTDAVSERQSSSRGERHSSHFISHDSSSNGSTSPQKGSRSSSRGSLNAPSDPMSLPNHSLTMRFNQLDVFLQNQNFEEAQFFCGDQLRHLSQNKTQKSKAFSIVFSELNRLLMTSNTEHLAQSALQLVRTRINEKEYDTLFAEKDFYKGRKTAQDPLTACPSYALTTYFNMLEDFIQKQDYDGASLNCGIWQQELLKKRTQASTAFAQVFGELKRMFMSSNEAYLAVFYLQSIRIRIDEEEFNSLFKPEPSLEEQFLRYKQEADAHLGGQFARDLFSEIQWNFKGIVE